MSKVAARFSSEFWRFWWAATLSNLGDGMRLAAFPLLATSLTSNPMSISLMSVASGLPWVFFSPFAGVLIDRHDRRRLLLAGQLGRGATIAVLASWLVLGMPSLWVLYIVALVMGTGEVLVDNTSQAAVPQLAPHGPGGLDAANGRLLAAQTVSNNVVGAPLGAAAFTVGAALPFIFDTLSFLLCGTLIALIRTPLQGDRDSARATSMVSDIRAGLAALWASPLLRRLAIAGGVFNLCLSGSFSVFVLLVVDEHSGSPEAYGLLLTVGAVGGFLGAIGAGRAARRFGRGPTLVGTTSLAGAGLVGLGTAPSLAVIAPLNLITIAAMVMSSVLSQSVRQAATPDHLLGRVVASFRMIGFAGIPAGGAIVGWLASATTVRAAITIAGLATVAPVAGIATAVRHLGASDR